MTEVQSPDTLRPGDLVGPWRIEGYAGRGSYGLVFRACRAEFPNSPPVALKLAAFANDPRFAREAVLLSRDIVPRRPSWRSRLRVAAVSGVLLLVTGSVIQLSPWPRMDMQAVAPSGETTGLGEDSLNSREVTQEATSEPKPISRDMSRQPLPGQQRPPCQRRGALVINGGCWKLQANIEAPCDDDDYEWQGACYRPIYDRKRIPNTRDSQ